MAETWPIILPSSPLIGWTEQPGKNAIRTETSAGPAKMRRRFTSAPSNFVLKMIMTEAQANTFMTFFTTTLASGVKTFEGLNHPRLDTDGEWRFLQEPMLLYQSYDVYSVAIRLELLP